MQALWKDSEEAYWLRMDTYSLKIDKRKNYKFYLCGMTVNYEFKIKAYRLNLSANSVLI